MPELLTIGEVSRRSGVAASALRFYEDRGLIASERAGSGHRRYPRPVLRRIAFIVFAQRVGLTLEEIGHLHGDHAAHFGFPRDVGAELREQGRVAPHPVNPYSTKMAARAIEDDEDVRDVIALMRLNYDRVAG